MNAVRTLVGLAAKAWRWRRALIAAVLMAPLAVAGGADLFAINALGLCWAAFAALRLARAIRGR